MAKLFGLTAEQQQRLARVADKVEGQPIQRANQQSGTSKPSPAFWVELTEEDPDNPGRYAWKVVDYVDHEWTDRDPEIASPEGEYSAIEANGGSGMAGQRVEVHFYGYDAEGKPRYLFGSPPPVILAKITGNLSANDYTAKSIRGAVADTATYADTDFGDALADEDDIIARDRAQIGGSTPRPLTGLIIAGKVIGRTEDGKRIVEFASAVQQIRMNTSDNQLQVAYLPNPSGDSDWVNMVEMEEACPEEE